MTRDTFAKHKVFFIWFGGSNGGGYREVFVQVVICDFRCGDRGRRKCFIELR